mgnify:CR=1 FL=1
MSKNNTRLLARVTNDGYLLGTTDDFENGWDDRYWADYYEDGWQENEIETVAIEIREDDKDKFLNHGTDDQYFGDGHEAWEHVLKTCTI